MGKQTVETIVEGGKAVTGPAMGQVLGPLGVNIGDVIAKINESTKDYAGMKVPVKIVVDDQTKAFEIKVGTPPASSLILKEAGLEKGSSSQTEPVGNISIEQAAKIAKMKYGDLLGNDLKNKVKEILGSCVTMGIKAENQDPRDIQQKIDAGVYDSRLKEDAPKQG